MSKADEIRRYIAENDTSAEMADGHWETDVEDDPMITTSLRLPKSLLDWVRTQAAAEHVKPTAWIRALIEQQRANETPLADRVSTMETALQALLAQSLDMSRGQLAVGMAEMRPHSGSSDRWIAAPAHGHATALRRNSAGGRSVRKVGFVAGRKQDSRAIAKKGRPKLT